MRSKTYISSISFQIVLPVLCVSYFSVFDLVYNTKKQPTSYQITHQNTFDWNPKTKTFKKYTGWWPPENTQIKGVEERILEVTPTSLKIKEYYHHTYCSERIRTFTFSSVVEQGKLHIKTSDFKERGVYQDCDSEPEILSGTAKIASEYVSFDDLLAGKVKDGIMITFWYYIPSKEEGIKMAIKIKKYQIRH